MVAFEDLGFFVEYVVDGKIVGTKEVAENPGGQIGYYSTRHLRANKEITFKTHDGKPSKKKIKPGDLYKTRIYPKCGKQIKK